MGKISKLDRFTLAYIECALWAENLDDLSISDVGGDTLMKIIDECEKFQELAGDLITDDNLVYMGGCDSTDRAGHDFYLTRNGHGAGFWDGDWKKEVGEKLTQLSKRFGEYNIEFEL